MRAHDEVVKFLTSGPTLTQIIDFEPSKNTRRRIAELEEHGETQQLTPDEAFELREFNRALSFIQRLKQRAMRRLARA
jgi:hypothetical protein